MPVDWQMGTRGCRPTHSFPPPLVYVGVLQRSVCLLVESQSGDEQCSLHPGCGTLELFILKKISKGVCEFAHIALFRSMLDSVRAAFFHKFCS